MKVWATTDRHESMMWGLLMSYRKSGFLMMFTQNLSSRLLHFHVCTTSGSIFRLYFRAASSRKSNRYFITGGMLLFAVSNVWKKSSMYFFNVPWNRKRKLRWLLVVLRIYVASAVFQPYCDLEISNLWKLKWGGWEPQSSCSVSQELNHHCSKRFLVGCCLIRHLIEFQLYVNSWQECWHVGHPGQGQLRVLSV